MSSKRTFSCHCIVIIPISHPAGGLTGESAKNVFILHSGVSKWSAFGTLGWPVKCYEGIVEFNWGDVMEWTSMMNIMNLILHK